MRAWTPPFLKRAHGAYVARLSSQHAAVVAATYRNWPKSTYGLRFVSLAAGTR